MSDVAMAQESRLRFPKHHTPVQQESRRVYSNRTEKGVSQGTLVVETLGRWVKAKDCSGTQRLSDDVLSFWVIGS